MDDSLDGELDDRYDERCAESSGAGASSRGSKIRGWAFGRPANVGPKKELSGRAALVAYTPAAVVGDATATADVAEACGSAPSAANAALPVWLCSTDCRVWLLMARLPLLAPRLSVEVSESELSVDRMRWDCRTCSCARYTSVLVACWGMGLLPAPLFPRPLAVRLLPATSWQNH